MKRSGRLFTATELAESRAAQAERERRAVLLKTAGERKGKGARGNGKNIVSMEKEGE